MRRRIWLVPVAATAVLAVTAVIVLLWPSSGSRRSDAAPTPAPSTPTPVMTVAAPQTTTAAPRPRPTTPHALVRSAGPTHFVMSGPAFGISANVCDMPYVRPLDPPGDQVHTVCWVESGFGVAPASDARGTSYVLGHAWAQEKLVLNPLSEFATAHVQARATIDSGVATYSVPALNGYRISLATPNGTLVYSVTRAYLVGKNDAARVASLMDEQIAKRVVLITCGVKNGVDLDQNVIVYASLASSTGNPRG
jgi:hypothetical protein